MDTVTIISIIICLLIALYFLRKYLAFGECKSRARLDGKVVIVTGANTGIGKESVKDLAARGAKVIMACRNQEKGQNAMDDIKSELKECNIVLYELDLASFASIRSFASKFKKDESRLDILLNNAGVMWMPYTKTKDGLEMQMGTNHFGHFYLTNLLLDMLRKSAPSRIVNVSSVAHAFAGRINFDNLNCLEARYDKRKAYGQSKLANILFTKELARRLKGSGVNTYVLHPGVVETELARHSLFIRFFFASNPVLKVLQLHRAFVKDAREGAQTSIYCCVDEDLADHTALYYSDCKIKQPSRAAQNEDDAKKLWLLSEEIVGLKQN